MSGDGDGDGCATADVKITQALPTVWLIVPRNGQTASVYDDSGATEWEVFRSALIGPQGLVTELQGAMQFGLIFHGGDKTWSCPGMEVISPKLNNLDALSAAYPMKGPPADGTISFGYYPLQEVLRLLKDTPASARQGSHAVVYASVSGRGEVCDADWFGGLAQGITDRGSKVDELYLGSVEDIAAEGSKLYLIAGHELPTDGPRNQQLAAAGNTGLGPFNPTNEAELVQALRTIAGDLVDCSVTLNGEVTSGLECEGTVQLDDRMLPCNDDNGWRLKDRHTIELVGEACDSLRGKPASKVRADFPCEVFEVF